MQVKEPQQHKNSFINNPKGIFILIISVCIMSALAISFIISTIILAVDNKKFKTPPPKKDMTFILHLLPYQHYMPLSMRIKIRIQIPICGLIVAIQ